MKDLLKGALMGAAVSAIVTAAVAGVVTLGGEPERSIAQSFRSGPTQPAALSANPRCVAAGITGSCTRIGSGS